MRLWLALVAQNENTSPRRRSRAGLGPTVNDPFAARAGAMPVKRRTQRLVRARPMVGPTSKPRARRTSATRPPTRSPVDQRSITVASYGAATATLFAILHVHQPDQKRAHHDQQRRYLRFRNRRHGSRVDWLQIGSAVLLRRFENNRTAHRRHELIANGEHSRFVR